MALLLPSLVELQPYITTLAATLNVVTLGFLVNLANLIRNAAKDKIEILEARNKAVQEAADDKAKLLEARIQILEDQRKGVQDDLERTEKWHTRRVEELTLEVEGYKNKLSSSLDKAGIDFESLLLGRSTGNIADELKQMVENSLAEMQGALKEVYAMGEPTVQANPDWYLELGKGLMAKGDWEKAAKQLDKYVQYDPTNWEVQFSRGVSYANTRKGKESDLLSLRAYNEAIAIIPPNSNETDVNMRARLFAYRGAMLKRLNRLDEAEADLNIAYKLARRDFEIRDIKYNLACVYALKGDRASLMDMIASLKSHKRHLEEFISIQSHLNDYFSQFANDKEFLDSIRLY